LIFADGFRQLLRQVKPARLDQTSILRAFSTRMLVCPKFFPQPMLSGSIAQRVLCALKHDSSVYLSRQHAEIGELNHYDYLRRRANGCGFICGDDGVSLTFREEFASVTITKIGWRKTACQSCNGLRLAEKYSNLVLVPNQSSLALFPCQHLFVPVNLTKHRRHATGRERPVVDMSYR